MTEHNQNKGPKKSGNLQPVKNTAYAHYEELLQQRDQLKKQATQADHGDESLSL